MAKLREDDPLSALSAAEFNRHVDASDDFHRRKQLGDRIHPGQQAVRSTDLIKVRNSTGGHLTQGSVVELGDYLLDQSVALEQQEHWVDGVLPTLALGKHHAVVVRAIEENEIYDAQLGGIAVARVNVTNVNHKFCIPTAGQTYFTSSPLGPYRLVSVPAAPGISLCSVALNGGALTLIAKADDFVFCGGDGTFSILDGPAGGETDTLIKVEAHNDGPEDIFQGDRARLTLINWQPFARLAGCEDSESSASASSESSGSSGSSGSSLSSISSVSSRSISESSQSELSSISSLSSRGSSFSSSDSGSSSRGSSASSRGSSHSSSRGSSHSSGGSSDSDSGDSSRSVSDSSGFCCVTVVKSVEISFDGELCVLTADVQQCMICFPNALGVVCCEDI